MAAMVLLAASPTIAAESAAPVAATTSAPTIQGTPALTGKALSDLFPAGTLFYKGWPGIASFSDASRETELAKLVKEPEFRQLRTTWWKTIWPAIEDQISAEIDDEKGQEIFELVEELLAVVWHHPTAVGLIGAGASEAGPQVDAAFIVRAGKDAPKLVDMMDRALTVAGVPADGAEEASVGDLNFKSLKESPLPVRWGVVDELFILSVGTKATEHLANGTVEQSLTRSPRFSAAMKTVGAQTDCPSAFLDIKGVLAAFKSFQPMLASSGVPFVSDPEAVDRLLTHVGADAWESLSFAMVPEASGFKTTMFLDMPGADSGNNPFISHKALIKDDIGVVPKSARWATVTNLDVAAIYRSMIDVLKMVMPGGEQAVADAIGDIEKRIGVSIEQDILGAFQDTWAIFDSPDFGGIWFSGMVVVVKVKPGNQLGKAMRNIAEVVAEEIGGDATVRVESEEYHGQKIEYLNISGIPMPIAPAWAEYQGRWIAALYPQMVRMEIDHLVNRGPSLLDNPDFQRGQKLMPTSPYSVTYVDTRAGVQQLYSFALPLWQVGSALLQKEDIPLNVGMLPSVQTVVRHIFGNVSASVANDKGVLTVSYGSLPVALPAIGEGGFIIPLGISVALPSLARARTMAKSTVSMSNLRQIGVASIMYSEEHQGKLPPDLQTLVDSGAMPEEILRSPQDESDATSSYIYIDGQTNAMDPRNVVAYENPEIQDNKATNVLFLDGHVDRMNMDRFKQVLEETYTRLGREMPDDLGAPEPKKTDATGNSKVQDARRQVSRGGTLAAAIDLFKTHVGRYPRKLKELSTQPEDEAEAEKWRGPYVAESAVLKDPWGRELEYLGNDDAKHNEGRYDLWSLGPDGKDGTEDDVTNWKRE